MNFVPPMNNENEQEANNQAAPPNLQALLQKIRRFRLPSDENIKTLSNKDSITLVDASPVKFPIFTKHHHYQLLNLCELSSDGEAIYFSSSSLALPESLVREAEINGEKKIATKEDLAAVSRRDYGSLRKLYVKTGNLCIVEKITLRSIFCITCAGGFVAVNNSSEVQIMHEATQKLVRGQFYTKKHINTVQLVPFRTNQNEQRVMLFICKNDGEVTCKQYYKTIVRLYDMPLQLNSVHHREEGNKFVARVHQQIIAPLNINFASIGSFEFGKYLLSAADDAKGPLIFQMNQHGMFELLHDALCYTKKTSSTMCSWQAQGPYLAMATERGQCIVWHFPSKEIVKELGAPIVNTNPEVEAEDDESDTSFTFSSEACIRLVKFNPVPLFNYILVFAEAKKNVHVVDTRTWKEQIIKVTEGDINGLCLSHDGKKLHVAHAEGIHVYDLILKKSLFESCVQYIHSNLHLKSQFNWQFDQLPREVQRKIDY